MNARTFLHCLAPTFLLAALAAQGAAQNPPPEPKPQSSSKAAAADNAKSAKKAKHVFTNDDFGSTRPGSSDTTVDISSEWNVESFFPKDPVTAKEIVALQKFIMPSYQFNLKQTKASVANLYLQYYKDVAFKGRAEWEERLFAGFECTRSAQSAYVKELDSASKDPQYRNLLTATRFSDAELRKIGALRTRLIAGWQPVRVCNAKFDAIRKEGWERAEEWLKTHPSKLD